MAKFLARFSAVVFSLLLIRSNVQTTFASYRSYARFFDYLGIVLPKAPSLPIIQPTSDSHVTLLSATPVPTTISTTIAIRSEPILTITPTVPPTLTPLVTIKPTKTPTPSPRPTAKVLRFESYPTSKPTHLPTSTPKINLSPSTNSTASLLLEKVNEYRKSQGLYEVKSDTYTCDFAQLRAKEISGNFNHDGFTNRVHNHELPYPSYSSIAENIAMTSDYTEVVPMWIDSAGHAENMRKDTPYVCIGVSGSYYAYEGWKP